jgi:tripartite-type tricarboxylate transporter receptor subunit TctC
MVLVAWAHLHALDVGGQHDLLARVQAAGVVHEGEAELHVLHLLGGIGAVPGVHRGAAALGVGDLEGQRGGGEDREAARLVARVDVGGVGDAVARHVVVVEGLAELLAGKKLKVIVPLEAFLMSSAQAISEG